jgi:hypothetical protein
MNSNVIKMPVAKNPAWRNWAKLAVKAYKVKKARERENASRLSQAEIDGRGEGRERESESTNAKLHRLLGGRQ